MKKQVTTIEQSKRLIELGVPAERASMIWDKSSVGRKYRLGVWNTDAETKAWEYRLDPKSFIPAFTVADLLGVMPKNIPAAGVQNHDYFLTLSHGFCWKLCYEDNRTHRRIGEEVDFDLVDILCNRIEWLVSNGYKLEE